MLRTLLPLLLAATAMLAPAAAGAAEFPYDVAGGTVIVKSMPKQSAEVQEAVSNTLLFEDDDTPLDPGRCPTGRLVVTAQKKATMDARWRKGGGPPERLAGLFIPAPAGRDCQIWLNARALHRYDESQICMLVRHELGHARGLGHTDTGLMQANLPLFATDVGCDWAWSSWLDDEL